MQLAGPLWDPPIEIGCGGDLDFDNTLPAIGRECAF